MADTKISALPASTTPLAGTEVLPIVQGGVTRQVSVANLTAGRAISATSVTASTGNFVVGTSGQGIDFSATPGTGTSELLNDYEEGTWTPLMSANGSGTDNWTSTTATGKYTKVGRLVTVTCIYTYTAKQSSTGSYGFMTGLPFVSGTADGFFSVQINNTTLADINSYAGRVDAGGSVIQFVKNQDRSGAGFMLGSDFPAATATISFQAVYMV